ncbi:serine/threonine-protein phosphatase 2A 65 kDa regulatory subunit A beta isoform-like isoform X1 [Hibiscus syriacus]|uniref:Serine/threonine-protein phosphatase 2A 65 kDa regulatory subunit A beta isoform-like isoform X1 n=1 Tax=Hibiscus syriacus TaxID=106335 RepID=A0A6A3AUI5_HIBSY|nr:serine/threonine-protein phosphatase 2A 65 kDa regulatory subunit A beta isoform-like isoform X1 [Hibiscus syriacus]
MATTIAVDPSLSLQIVRGGSNQHGAVIEEILGQIKVYKDGHTERPQIVPFVSPTLPLKLGVSTKDVVVDEFTDVWGARFYVPKSNRKLPLVVYFHGRGFCVGSAAWSCYHDFLAKLAAEAGCLIVLVNYRVFLAGDSAGANIAHNVVIRLGFDKPYPLILKGTILIQPFFGGETRTESEKHTVQPPRSALSLAASDTYWRLALPCGANRDHPWSNPSAKMEETRLLPTLVCISEMDILRDRNLAFCGALAKAGNKVEHVLYKGVGHAFQVLSKSLISQTQTKEMIAHVKAFLCTDYCIL